MKKKTIIVIASVLVLVLIVGLVLFFVLNKSSDYKQAELKGYKVSVPKTWEVISEENTLVFKEDGAEQGRFTLLYHDCELKEIPANFGYKAENLVVSESTKYAAKVYEFSFSSEGKPIVQYVFNELPVAPPYKAVLTLCDVPKKTALKMVSGIVLPSIESFAPAKPLSTPEGEGLEETVYTVKNEYGYFSYNINKLSIARCV